MKDSLKQTGQKLVADIEKGRNPALDVPIRNLSNVSYDTKTKLIRLGKAISKRYFFNVAHVRKFVQTIEVATTSKDLLDVGKHLSLREVFYRIKRTIPGTSVNIVDEQEESVAPDELLLVRLNGVMKFMTGVEILDYARKHGKKIYDDGKKEKYEDIDLVTCGFDKNYKIREMPVRTIIKHPSNAVKKITTASGKSVKVTLSHSLFISKWGLPKAIKAGELKVGDYIAVPRRINVIPKSEQIDIVKKLISNCPEKILSLLTLRGKKEVLSRIIKSIDKGALEKFVRIYYKSRLYTVLGNWRRSGIPLRLFKELNLDISNYYNELNIIAKGSKHKYNCLIKCDKDLGAVLGFLISEGGHSLGRKRLERSITIANSKKELLELFADSFTKTFGEKPGGRIIKSKDGTYKINIGYDLLSYILEYALEYKPIRAWDKTLPSCLLDANEETVSGFIKWYRLGDGSIADSTTKQINFHTTSLSLVNGVVFLLLRLGVLPRVYNIESKEPNRHKYYVIRVANREDIIRLSKVTGDFVGMDLEKTTSFSGDRIPNIAEIVRNNLDKLKMTDEAYKKFNWYGWANQGGVSRATLANSNALMEEYGPIDARLQLISNYDIAWDKIISIEDAEMPPYTIDLEVPEMQNFIGGNGLIILHNSNKAIEDLELITGCSREQLNINANKMGSVAGKVVIKDKGDLVDWSKLGSGGWSIPSNVEEIEFKKVNAKFIIYMEKAAEWERLHEDRVWEKLNCLIMSSQGQATRGVRRLLERLHREFKLPVYVLVDGDPWGAYIYSVLKYGSISLAHISESLAIPGARFLGLSANDVTKYELKKHLIKFKDIDIKRLQEISKYEWFKDNKDWQKEFRMWKELGGKVELAALSSKGISFISDKYIPEKIKNKEWLE